jgi:hypothetical protein
MLGLLRDYNTYIVVHTRTVHTISRWWAAATRAEKILEEYMPMHN